MKVAFVGRHVGQRRPPIDWKARTSGQEKYVGDLVPPDALYGAILRSPHAHAVIESIDVSEAKGMPGVHAVITGADFPPGARYPFQFDRALLADGVVRFVGDEVAAVAAETREQARAAAAAIQVNYRRRPTPLIIREALASGAPRLFNDPVGPFRPSFLPPPNSVAHLPNVRRRIQPKWGNPAKGDAASSIFASGKFWFPQQSQTCMETHQALAEWRDGRLHLWIATATPMVLRDILALMLGMQPSDVIIHEAAVGGSFGAKIFISTHEILAATLARVTERPVYIGLTREEDFETSYSRHGAESELTFGADTSGKVRIIKGKCYYDNGAYIQQGDSVMGAGLWSLTSTYDVDGVDVDAKLVDTSKTPGGAMRGYGEPQLCFAREMLMDELAEKFGRDPIDFRIQNAYRTGMTALGGDKLGDVGLARCLETVRDASDWTNLRKNRKPGYGIGVAASGGEGGPNIFPGTERADSAIDLHRDGRVRLRTGCGDAGTGQKTILAQVVAEELGIAFEDVSVQSMDTEATTFDMGAMASRGTHYSAHSARLTASRLADRLKEMAGRRLGPGEIRLEEGFARGTQGEVSLGDLVAMNEETVDGVLTHQESFVDTSTVCINPNEGKLGKISPTHYYGAHVAVVHVDEKTGALRLKDYFAAHDSGTVINPMMVEGQISGGAVMGIGAALGEEMIFWQGKLVNPAFLHYAQPRAADLPKINAIHVPAPDDAGPYGAKAIGELPTILGPSAVAAAVRNAIGVSIHSLPITPDKIINALNVKNGRKRRFAIWARPSRWWIALVRRAYPLGLFKLLHEYQMRSAKSSQALKPLKAVEMPASIEELTRSLAPDAMIIGGGTDVQLQRRQHLSAPDRLISVAKVDALKHVSEGEDGSLVIGAGVTLSDFADLVRGKLPGFAEAIEEIATPQVRNVATIAGNLSQAKRCWFFRNGFPCYKRTNEATFAPCYAVMGDHRFYHAAIDGHRCQAVTPSDLGTALTALDARVRIAGRDGTREIPIDQFYVGPGETSLLSDEVVVQISIPGEALRRSFAFKKLRLWEGDFAVASAALSVELDADGCCGDVRLCLGAVAPVPWRARATEVQLKGRRFSASLLREQLDAELDRKAHPLDRNAWKIDAVAGLAERAVEQLADAG